MKLGKVREILGAKVLPEKQLIQSWKSLMNLKESKREILRFFGDHFLYYVITRFMQEFED